MDGVDYKEDFDMTFEINQTFTDEEMGAIIRALNEYMYSNELTKEQWNAASSALGKILSDVE